MHVGAGRCRAALITPGPAAPADGAVGCRAMVVFQTGRGDGDGPSTASSVVFSDGVWMEATTDATIVVSKSAGGLRETLATRATRATAAGAAGHLVALGRRRPLCRLRCNKHPSPPWHSTSVLPAVLPVLPLMLPVSAITSCARGRNSVAFAGQLATSPGGTNLAIRPPTRLSTTRSRG